MNRYLVAASANIVVIKQGKVLLCRRQNTGFMDGWYGLPGGHVEAGEKAREGAAREMKEELGLALPLDRFVFLCVCDRDSKSAYGNPYNYVAYEFKVVLSPDEVPVNAEADKCSEILWADPHNLPKDVIPVFSQVITRAYLAGERYLESD